MRETQKSVSKALHERIERAERLQFHTQQWLNVQRILRQSKREREWVRKVEQ